MKSLIVIIAVTLAVTGCQKSDVSSSLTAQQPETCVQQKSSTDGDSIAGQYIIAYNSVAGRSREMSKQFIAADESLLERNAIAKTSLLVSFGGKPGGFVARLSTAELNKLKSDAAIDMIEPDRVIALGNCFTVVAPRLITWNITKTGYGNGIGKVAWIIDTGIDFTHPDLTTDAGRSKSFLIGQTSPADENGHGTHVSGIIGAKNNTIGVLGIASGATMISMRVLDKDGNGTTSGIVQALAWISANGHAGDAVNMSVGGEGISEILDQQVKNTASKGIYISIAAGNEHKPANQSSPARVNGTNIYTVSAVDSTGKFASFSNYGNDVVDYAAPGVQVLSTYPGNRYATMSGTSMAAPHLTGLLLLNGNNIHTSGTAHNDPDGNPDAIAHQ